MEEIRSVRAASDELEAAHEAFAEKYRKFTQRLDREEERMEERYESLEKRREAIAAEHRNENASPHDLVEINAGGRTIAARRRNLCLFGRTRMEALFRGCWDKKLQRDKRGRIFLDVNPNAFQAIVDFLNELAISSPEDDSPAWPAVDGEIESEAQHMMGLLLDNSNIATSSDEDPCLKVEEATEFTPELNDALNWKIGTLRNADKKISSLERQLNDEENFIERFATGSAKDIVKLNVSGTAMATKRSTLMVFGQSALARQFDDSKWTEQGCEHRVSNWAPDDVFIWARGIDDVPDDVAKLFVEHSITGNELLALDREGLMMLGIKRAGTLCLLSKEIKNLERRSGDVTTLIEHSPYCFGKILDFLRKKHLMSQDLGRFPETPTVRESEQCRFEKVVKYFFPGDSSELILGPGMPICISMARNATVDPNASGDDYLKDGRPLREVTLVAAVRNYEEHLGDEFHIDVDDGTGSMRVVLKLDEQLGCANSTVLEKVCKARTYVRIVGAQVEDFGGQRHILARSIRSLTSWNELTGHFADIARMHDRHVAKQKHGILKRGPCDSPNGRAQRRPRQLY